ncbi:hypothetical protein OSCI_3770022 [Kamptonema sp. PCC 6506]|uniref:hypothetical protein n=1 Tax=Kamptonema formosum TaxID=331992 RepID=UPI0001DAC1AC|nr:hypothetical protein [Kamptonema formosum]CBN58436.1 hypothetical protein OSCI_3770022 [Kamptonema sp. PCC 6506]
MLYKGKNISLAALVRDGYATLPTVNFGLGILDYLVLRLDDESVEQIEKWLSKISDLPAFACGGYSFQPSR